MPRSIRSFFLDRNILQHKVRIVFLNFKGSLISEGSYFDFGPIDNEKCQAPSFCNETKVPSEIKPISNLKDAEGGSKWPTGQKNFSHGRGMVWLLWVLKYYIVEDVSFCWTGINIEASRDHYTHSLSIRNDLIRNDPSNSSIIRNHDPLNKKLCFNY